MTSPTDIPARQPEPSIERTVPVPAQPERVAAEALTPGSIVEQAGLQTEDLRTILSFWTGKEQLSALSQDDGKSPGSGVTPLVELHRKYSEKFQEVADVIAYMRKVNSVPIAFRHPPQDTGENSLATLLREYREYRREYQEKAAVTETRGRLNTLLGERLLRQKFQKTLEARMHLPKSMTEAEFALFLQEFRGEVSLAKPELGLGGQCERLQKSQQKINAQISLNLQVLRDGNESTDASLDELLNDMWVYLTERDSYEVRVRSDTSPQPKWYDKFLEAGVFVAGIESPKLTLEAVRYLKRELPRFGIAAESLPPVEQVLPKVTGEALEVRNALLSRYSVDYLLFAYIIYNSPDKLKAAMEFGAFVTSYGVADRALRGVGMLGEKMLVKRLGGRALGGVLSKCKNPWVRTTVAILASVGAMEMLDPYIEKIDDFIPESEGKKFAGDALHVGTGGPIFDFMEDLNTSNIGVSNPDREFVTFMSGMTSNVKLHDSLNLADTQQDNRPTWLGPKDDASRRMNKDAESWDNRLDQLLQATTSVAAKRLFELERIGLPNREECDRMRSQKDAEGKSDLAEWRMCWMKNRTVARWAAETYMEAARLRAREVEFQALINQENIIQFRMDPKKLEQAATDSTIPLKIASLSEFALSDSTPFTPYEPVDFQLRRRLTNNESVEGTFWYAGLRSLNFHIGDNYPKDSPVARAWRGLVHDAEQLARRVSIYRNLGVYERSIWMEQRTKGEGEERQSSLPDFVREGSLSLVAYNIQRRQALEMTPQQTPQQYAKELVDLTRPLPAASRNWFETVKYLVDIGAHLEYLIALIPGTPHAERKKKKEKMKKLVAALYEKASEISTFYPNEQGANFDRRTAAELTAALEPVRQLALRFKDGGDPSMEDIQRTIHGLNTEVDRARVYKYSIIPYDAQNRSQLPLTLDVMEHFDDPSLQEKFHSIVPPVVTVMNAKLYSFVAAGGSEKIMAEFLEEHQTDVGTYQSFMRHADFYNRYFQSRRRLPYPVTDRSETLERILSWDRMGRKPLFDADVFSQWQRRSQMQLQQKYYLSFHPRASKGELVEFLQGVDRATEARADDEYALLRNQRGFLQSLAKVGTEEAPGEHEGSDAAVMALPDIERRFILGQNQVEQLSPDVQREVPYYLEGRTTGGTKPHAVAQTLLQNPWLYRSTLQSVVASSAERGDVPRLFRVPGLDPLDPKKGAFTIRGFIQAFARYESPHSGVSGLPRRLPFFHPPKTPSEQLMDYIEHPSFATQNIRDKQLSLAQLGESVTGPLGGQGMLVRTHDRGLRPFQLSMVDGMIAVEARDLPKFLQSFMQGDGVDAWRMRRLEQRVIVVVNMAEQYLNKGIAQTVHTTEGFAGFDW